MEFAEWLVLSEASQQETQALKILGGDEQALARLKSISPEPKFLPVLALFSKEQPDLGQLGQDWAAYKGFMGDKRMPVLAVQGSRVVYSPNNEPVTYLQWSERVHALAGESEMVQKRLRADHSGDRPPIFKSDDLEVYETFGPGDCIKYGKGYSFCISQPGNTMWQSYRDNQASTFYFVYDKSRPDTDPLHIVVVDINERGPKLTDANNTTGYVGRYGVRAEAYLNHLYERGVPRDLFKNKPHTAEEEKEKKELGYRKTSLEWFKGLPPDYKSKYIGRGHELADEQFDYIFDNGLESLVKQYAEVGRRLNDHQMDRMLRSKFRSTYLHFRVIANQHAKDLDVKEYDKLSENQKESLSPDIHFAMLLKKGQREKAIEFLPASKGSAFALEAAASVDDVDMLESLEEMGKLEPNHVRRAVKEASNRNSLNAMTWLVQRGGDPKYALEATAGRGNLRMLKWLIEKSMEHEELHPSKNGAEHEMQAAIIKAAKVGRHDIFSYLTSPENELNSLVDFDSEYLYKTLGQKIVEDLITSEETEDDEGQIKILDTMIQKGYVPDAFSAKWAMRLNKTRIVLFLADKKQVDVHIQRSLIEVAAEKGDMSMIKQLMDKMENKGIEDNFAYHLFYGASLGGQIEVLEFALEEVMSNAPSMKSFYLDLSIRSAIFKSHIDVMKWAADRGARPDDACIKIAVKSNQIKALKWLVERMGDEGVATLKKEIKEIGDGPEYEGGATVDRSAIRKYAEGL